MATTVVIGEDDPLFLTTLRQFLRNSPGVQVVAEAADGREVVRLTRELGPNVVVMDAGLPIIDGFEATQLITASCPEVRVVVLSGTVNDKTLARAQAAGAVAVISKARAFEELAEALRPAHARASIMPPQDGSTSRAPPPPVADVPARDGPAPALSGDVRGMLHALGGAIGSVRLNLFSLRGAHSEEERGAALDRVEAASASSVDALARLRALLEGPNGTTPTGQASVTGTRPEPPATRRRPR